MTQNQQSKLASIEIQKSREERTSHIDLSSPCEFDLSWRRFIRRTGLVRDAHTVWCHACSNDTNSEQTCTNPKHVYLGTQSENCLDKPDETRCFKKPAHWTANMKQRLCQPVVATNIETNEVFYFESAKQAAEQLNCSRGCISEVISGNRKQHKGFRFAKAN